MKIDVPLDAVPQGRPRFYNGHAVDPKRSRDFKNALKLFVQNKLKNYGDVFSDKSALNVAIYFYRSKTRFKGVTDPRFGDIDNLIKAVLDALNGLVWKDDRQIVSLFAKKKLSNEPHIEIWIDEMTPLDYC